MRIRHWILVAALIGLATPALAVVKIYNASPPGGTAGDGFGYSTTLCPPIQVTPGNIRGNHSLTDTGGGTVTVMTMVICNRPVHQAVATAAGVGFIIGLPGAIGFLILGLDVEGLPLGSVGYINLPALAAISALSLITTPIGARWAHSLDERKLKRLFGCYLLFVSCTMFYKAATL